MEKTRKWKYGVNRWFVLLFTVAGAFAARVYPPIRPHIQVAPEPITPVLFTLPVFGDFRLTNTLVAIFIVDLLLILMALAVNRAIKRGDMVLKGLPGAIEGLVEFAFNFVEGTAGKKWAKTIFPWFMTIVLVVLLANWMELLPGVDSIGLIEKAAHGTQVKELAPGIMTTISASAHEGEGYVVTPFLRVPSTDLNFTAALALISVTMTQIIGLRAQGIRYFSKFFNTLTLFKKPLFGAIDFAVGLLELISELAKLLSFSFRLFGNIFAGSVLLFLIGSMIPIFLQSGVLLFEFFIGLIQAAVFGILTMVFMTMATQGHGEEEHA